MYRRFKCDVLDQLPTKRRQMVGTGAWFSVYVSAKQAKILSIVKVLLDATLTKNKDRSDWKDMKEGLTKAGKLKVH